MSHTLILGFGNVDRQDDGVAWHILVQLTQYLGGQPPASLDDEFPSNVQGVDFLFTLQLTPELAETLAGYERVCFVDAHTGSVPADMNVAPVASVFQNSPFTHHLTPSTLLSFTQTLYGKSPHCILVSVRGYEFGFSRALSERTAQLAQEAADNIKAWLAKSDLPS
jgi:hydrogenase maturation protease